MLNENIFDGIGKELKGGVLRKEDEISDYDREFVDTLIELFSNEVALGGVYRNEYSEFVDWFKRGDGKTAPGISKVDNIKSIYKYVDDNWDDGDNICEIIDNRVEEILSEHGYMDESKHINENIFDGIGKESKGDAIRKEDNEKLYEKIVDTYINMFCDYDSYEIELFDFINFIKDCANSPRILKYKFDMKSFIDYVKDNWEDGYGIEGVILEMMRKNECDVASPNGGLVFGDVAGMGPITFPGECGEKGSGDLPMPSGRVYQQVAPFSTFKKLKWKKKKKFRKSDEPCSHSPNKPVYNYVDDYRDYVDRTYNKVDKG